MVYVCIYGQVKDTYSWMILTFILKVNGSLERVTVFSLSFIFCVLDTVLQVFFKISCGFENH